jgi:hypothetical protein
MYVTDVLIVNDNLIAQAVRELGISVPVLRVEAHGSGLKLWLYGGQGEPVVWEPKKAETKPQPVQPKAETKPQPAKATPKPKAKPREGGTKKESTKK